MKKIIVILLPLMFLVFLSCPEDVTSFDFDFESLATVLSVESALLGEAQEVYVNFLVTFLLTQPSGEMIIERSIGDSNNFAIIDTMYDVEPIVSYTDSDTLLQPNTTVYYRLSLLENNELEHLTTEQVDIPGEQHFYSPAEDTLLGDTLNLTFAQIQNFSDCSVELYELKSTDPESLIAYTNPLFDTSLTYPDTFNILIPLPDSIFPDTNVYVIKLMSSQTIQYITDSSIGFRAFFKAPEF
jgi:hypothetical protein